MTFDFIVSFLVSSVVGVESIVDVESAAFADAFPKISFPLCGNIWTSFDHIP